MNNTIKFYLIIGLVLFLIPSSLFPVSKRQLNEDAVSIIGLIKKSSEPQLYEQELRIGIKKYSEKLSRYSSKEVSYVAEVCRSFIELELTVWNSFVGYYNKHGSSSGYDATKIEKVKEILKRFESYGIKMNQEIELPIAVNQFSRMSESMPKRQFQDFLNQIGQMMHSDYYKTYNAIFE